MSKRKKIPREIELEVLAKSKRRCCLCFGLNHDESVKEGQIAHIDRNSANNASDNLVFLCLDHHNKYDSKTSQAKGITEDEVRHYRNLIHEKFKSPVPVSEHANRKKDELDVIQEFISEAQDLKKRFEDNLGIEYLAEPDEEGKRYHIPIFNFLRIETAPDEKGAIPYFQWAHDFQQYLVKLKDFFENSGVKADIELFAYFEVFDLHTGKSLRKDYEDFDDFDTRTKTKDLEKQMYRIDRLIRTIPENLQKHVVRLQILHKNLSGFRR